MIRNFVRSILALALVLAMAVPAFAHFGMTIPADSAATMTKKNTRIDFSFSHPFAGVGMNLVKPAKAGVLFNGKITDLLPNFKKATIMDHEAWSVDYAFKRPGVYTFFMEPKPYWEPAEDCSIIHYTKVSVPAFGGDEGWDEPLGLKTEIVPMLRPFGNYAGNSFTGLVLLDGKPVPGAEVEVELYNQGRFENPTDYHETQVVKADGNGVFTFTCPQPGWWGFAALNEADFTINDPSGKAKPVEIGAVFWTYMNPWK
jgi:cobalt/nickel transport protein